MRVLILADELFASREQSMLARLEVGLADEGVRVIHAIPERAAATTARSADDDLTARTVTYSDLTMPFASRFRAAALASSLAALLDPESEPDDDGDDRPIDVIHAFGGGVWTLATHLARLTGAGIVLEVWRSGLVDRAHIARRRHGPPIVFLAPDPTIERALLVEATGLIVRPAPWGVHVQGTPREILPDHRLPSIMLVGSGLHPDRLAHALAGLAGVVKRGLDCLIFADARAVHRARLWPLAEKLGLLSRLSLIDELEGRRELVLLGDVLLLPETHGEQRSIVLDAMAQGMVVVASKDPSVSSMIDHQTARLVSTPTPESWDLTLASVLTDRAGSRALGRSARQYVKDRHPASTQVRAVLDAYSWLANRDAIPFQPSA